MTKPALWMTMKPKVVKKRRPLRRRSKAMDEKMVEYNRLKAVFIEEHPRCIACPHVHYLSPHRTTDVHHFAGRAGNNLLDTRGWLPVCRSCHDWIGNHPTEARKLGLLCPVGQWNRPIK